MAKFIRFRKDEFLNLDRVVSYTLCRVNYEDCEEEQQRQEMYSIRFLLDCATLEWVETEIMDIEAIDYMLERINK